LTSHRFPAGPPYSRAFPSCVGQEWDKDRPVPPGRLAATVNCTNRPSLKFPLAPGRTRSAPERHPVKLTSPLRPKKAVDKKSIGVAGDAAGSDRQRRQDLMDAITLWTDPLQP